MFKQFSTQAIIDRALNAVFTALAPQANFYEPPALPRRPSDEGGHFHRRNSWASGTANTKNAAFVGRYRSNPLNYLPTRVVNSCLKNTKTQLAAERLGYKILCDMAKEKLVAEPTWEMQSKYGKAA